MLQLDHVFCFVPPDGDWAGRLTAAGWALDAGTVHEGQGSRNRRLAFAGQFLELVWLHDPEVARNNPLRLDRRAEWVASGASPFGFGLRGRLPPGEQEQFWSYDLLGLRIWVHRDNERAPERPMVFVLELDPAELERTRSRVAATPHLVGVRHTGPAPAPLPPFDGPPVDHAAGAHHVALVVDRGAEMQVTERLSIVTMAG
jgi:hypothetical protein